MEDLATSVKLATGLLALLGGWTALARAYRWLKDRKAREWTKRHVGYLREHGRRACIEIQPEDREYAEWAVKHGHLQWAITGASTSRCQAHPPSSTRRELL